MRKRFPVRVAAPLSRKRVGPQMWNRFCFQASDSTASPQPRKPRRPAQKLCQPRRPGTDRRDTDPRPGWQRWASLRHSPPPAGRRALPGSRFTSLSGPEHRPKVIKLRVTLAVGETQAATPAVGSGSERWRRRMAPFPRGISPPRAASPLWPSSLRPRRWLP